jgi:hypothetical protein
LVVDRRVAGLIKHLRLGLAQELPQMLGSNHETPEQRGLLGPNQGEFFQPAEPASPPEAGDQSDVDRWARLVADGQVPLPLHLRPSKREAIVRKASQLRRLRLMEFISRAIAQDILQSRDQLME